MAFTSGFFNSLKNDRMYNTDQISELFDGILKDGIIPSQGELFAVKSANNGMQITIGTGRAWFDHTWSKNDSVMVLNVSAGDVARGRYDAVVLEVNHTIDTRDNSIKIVQGEPAVNPVKPALVNTDEIKQYPLAYIHINAGASAITASDIENMIGREPTVFATGILESVSIDSLWAQWKGDWETWFNGIKLQLTENVVTNLQYQIDNKVNVSDKATQAQATAGTDNTKWMTPLRVKEAIEHVTAVSGSPVVDAVTGKPMKVVSMPGPLMPTGKGTVANVTNFMGLPYSVIIDNYLYVYTGSGIEKIDVSTGNQIKNATSNQTLYRLDSSVSYIDGVQGVFLADGRAGFIFDANAEASRTNTVRSLLDFDYPNYLLQPDRGYSSMTGGAFISDNYWGFLYQGKNAYGSNNIRYVYLTKAARGSTDATQTTLLTLPEEMVNVTSIITVIGDMLYFSTLAAYGSGDSGYGQFNIYRLNLATNARTTMNFIRITKTSTADINMAVYPIFINGNYAYFAVYANNRILKRVVEINVTVSNSTGTTIAQNDSQFTAVSGINNFSYTMLGAVDNKVYYQSFILDTSALTLIPNSIISELSSEHWWPGNKPSIYPSGTRYLYKGWHVYDVKTNILSMIPVSADFRTLYYHYSYTPVFQPYTQYSYIHIHGKITSFNNLTFATSITVDGNKALLGFPYGVDAPAYLIGGDSTVSLSIPESSYSAWTLEAPKSSIVSPNQPDSIIRDAIDQI